MRSLRALIDVDGVILDLIGGFTEWAKAAKGVQLDFSNVLSPRVPDEYRPIFIEFLKRDDCYSFWVQNHDGAIQGIKDLHDLGFEIVFNTATAVEAPEAYGTKLKRITEICELINVPFVFIGTPGFAKHYVSGTIGIDDRADSCLNYARVGTMPFLVLRKWSFDPENGLTLDSYCDETRNFDLGYIVADEHEVVDYVKQGYPFVGTGTAWDAIVSAAKALKEELEHVQSSAGN